MAETSKNKIYYNDDENSVADVLTDMKKMAESTDKAIENSKYNDAQIKKDISDAKKEQATQNTSITNLQKDNETNKEDITSIKEKDISQDKYILELEAENVRLREDMNGFPQGQASGESIDLIDSAERRFKEFKVKGNSKQETREGYNLLKNTATTKTINGVTLTVYEDGTVIAEGTATDKIAFNLMQNFALTDGEEYSLNSGAKGSSKTTYGLLINQYYDGISHIQASYDSPLNFNYNIKSMNTNSIYIYIIKGTTMNNVVFKPMLLKGNYTKDTLPPYEQYVGGIASPNLNYPQEVEGCGDNGNINVEICNKNFLNCDAISGSITRNGVTVVKNSNGSFTCSGTNTAANTFSLTGNMNFKVTKKMIGSGKNNLQGLNYLVQYYKKGDTALTYASFEGCIFNEGDIIDRIYMQQNKINISVSGTVFPQLEEVEGETATEYVEHQSQSYTIPTQKPMLEGDKFVKQNEKWYEKHGFGALDTFNNKNTYISAINIDEKDGKKFYRYCLVVLNDIKRKNGCYLKVLSTHFKHNDSRWNVLEGICGWESGNSFCIGTYDENYNTIEKMQTFLMNNHVKIYYELAEPQLIECTEEQNKILDKIENEAKTYKNVTHIYSTDEVNANMECTYFKDLETILNNMQAQILAE
jgi:hypothetical protein